MCGSGPCDSGSSPARAPWLAGGEDHRIEPEAPASRTRSIAARSSRWSGSTGSVQSLTAAPVRKGRVAGRRSAFRSAPRLGDGDGRAVAGRGEGERAGGARRVDVVAPGRGPTPRRTGDERHERTRAPVETVGGR